MGYENLYLLAYDLNSASNYINQDWLLKDEDTLNQHTVFILESTMK